jgi:abortive infection bacteriophage resistance protein
MSTNGLHSIIKFHLTASEQVTLLKSRGMVIADDQAAEKTLLSLGYYRLAGHFYPLRKTNPYGVPGRQDDFQDGTSLALVERIYEFDRQLRLLVLDAVERIEVAVRCDIAHRLGKRHRIAHERPDELDTKFCTQVNPATGTTKYQEWTAKLGAAVSKARKEDFVKHHQEKYGGRMPIWVITELWDFGLLSRFFAGMQYRDQTYIARRYGLQEGKYLASWLRAINFIRNVSAHHSRLWNRNIVERPRFQPSQPHQHLYHLGADVHAQTRVYGTLCVLKTMLNAAAPNNNWAERLKMPCAAFPASPLVSLNDAGFPADWREKSLWQ